MKLTKEKFDKAKALLDAIRITLDMQGKFEKYQVGVHILYDILCETEIAEEYEDYDKGRI